MIVSALVLIFPLLALLIFATFGYVRSERARLETTSLEENVDLGLAVEHDLITLIAALKALAVSIRYDSDLSHFKTQADEALAPRNGDLLLLDEHNINLLASGTPTMAPPPLAEIGTDADRTVGDVEISDLLPEADGYGRRLTICVQALTASNKRVVLVFAMQPAHFQTILRSSGLGPPYSEVIVDRIGATIARSGDGEHFVGREVADVSAMKGQSGRIDTVSMDGVALRRFYRRSPLAGWFILTSIPTKSLHAPLMRSLWLLAGVALVLVLTVVPIATVLSRRMRSATALAAHSARRLLMSDEVVYKATGIAETDLIQHVLTEASVRLREQAASLKSANRDLEERVAQRSRELASSHALTNSILENSPDTIEVLDDRGCLVFTNNKGHRSSQTVDQGSGEGRIWTALWSGSSRPLAEEALGHAQGGAPGRFTGVVEAPLTDAQWYEVLVTPMLGEDGKVQRILAVSRNITSRHLRDGELQDAKQRAEKAFKVRAEFLATMSHELRTPLNGILGYADLLASDRQLPEAQRLKADRIQDAALGLLGIVNDVLDLAKIEAGEVTLRLQPLRLKDEIQRALSVVLPIAEKKGLRLEALLDPNLPDLILADGERVRQILLNLISNALKFTEKGGVDIIATGYAASSNLVEVTLDVRDTGIGIAEHNHQMLFQRFSQVDTSSERRFGGTGLGLAITRDLVEEMGGTIEVESAPGRGSVFRVRITFAVIASLDGLTAKPEPVPSDIEAHVLVVEDNALNQDLIRHLLEATGCTVDVVSSGQSAIAAVQDAVYDLVLMDEQMPGMTGSTATLAIRALDHPARDIVIIGCSANVFSDQVSRFKEAGMNGFVAKPLTRAALARMLVEYVPARTGPESQFQGREGGADVGAPYQILPEKTVRAALIETRRELVALRSVHPLDDPQASARRAHSLISSACILQLDGLADACQSFEQACLFEVDIEAAFARMVDAIDVVIPSIDCRLPYPNSSNRADEAEMYKPLRVGS